MLDDRVNRRRLRSVEMRSEDVVLVRVLLGIGRNEKGPSPSGKGPRNTDS